MHTANLMKLTLIFNFTITATTLFASGINAQITEDSTFSAQRGVRENGSFCGGRITRADETNINWNCSHVIITDSGKGLNFHFKSVSGDIFAFIAHREPISSDETSNIFEVTGYFVRIDGEYTRPRMATGFCIRAFKNSAEKLKIICKVEDIETKTNLLFGLEK
jgi:hypothetical protein